MWVPIQHTGQNFWTFVRTTYSAFHTGIKDGFPWKAVFFCSYGFWKCQSSEMCWAYAGTFGCQFGCLMENSLGFRYRSFHPSTVHGLVCWKWRWHSLRLPEGNRFPCLALIPSNRCLNLLFVGFIPSSKLPAIGKLLFLPKVLKFTFCCDFLEHFGTNRINGQWHLKSMSLLRIAVEIFISHLYIFASATS